MPGLVQIPRGKALFYFEIALPKLLDMRMRERIKAEAQALLEFLVDRQIRLDWSQGNTYGGSHQPGDIREFADARCGEACKNLEIRTTDCDSDFYCWTGDERICYHPFTVWLGNVKQRVSIRTNGMEFTTDLMLMMAYPTDVAKKKAETRPKRTSKAKKRPAKGSKRKSIRKK